MLRLIKLLCLGYVFICTLSLQLAQAVVLDQDESKKAVEAFVLNNAQSIVSVLESKDGVEQKRRLLTALADQVFDYEWMGRFAIAKYWNTMSKQQQQDYLQFYKHYLSALYVERYNHYNNHQYNIKNTSKINDSQFMVTTEVFGGSGVGTKVTISYRIKIKNDKLQCIDIIVEGVSLLSNQRSDFSATVEQKGIGVLIQNLKAR